MIMLIHDFAQVKAFGLSVASELARTMPDRGAWPEIQIERVRQLRNMAHPILDGVKRARTGEERDLEELASLFEQVRQSAYILYAALSEMLSALPDARRDSATEPLNILLGEVGGLHNCLNELAWVLGEHAADQSEKHPDQFIDTDGLFKALGV